VDHCRGLFENTIPAFLWDDEERTENPVSDPKFESGPSRYEASTLSTALFGRTSFRQRWFVLESWQYRLTDVEQTQIFSRSFEVGYQRRISPESDKRKEQNFHLLSASNTDRSMRLKI
jgi:hypothetical protein